MPDILIRDVPADDLARIDARASRLGLSRSEYLRRRLRDVAASTDTRVTAAALRGFSRRFSDLADPELMGRVWS